MGGADGRKRNQTLTWRLEWTMTTSPMYLWQRNPASACAKSANTCKNAGKGIQKKIKHVCIWYMHTSMGEPMLRKERKVHVQWTATYSVLIDMDLHNGTFNNIVHTALDFLSCVQYGNTYMYVIVHKLIDHPAFPWKAIPSRTNTFFFLHVSGCMNFNECVNTSAQIVNALGKSRFRPSGAGNCKRETGGCCLLCCACTVFMHEAPTLFHSVCLVVNHIRKTHGHATFRKTAKKRLVTFPLVRKALHLVDHYTNPKGLRLSIISWP
jgi:hypothetical protein